MEPGLMIRISHRHTGRLLLRVEADSLEGADLRRASLAQARLRGANLRGANLQDADLRGADLRGADLRGADLRGANLNGALMRSVDPLYPLYQGESEGPATWPNLLGALYDHRTLWPEDCLDPQVLGCVFQRRPADVVPAPAPEGRGDEASPAE
jgi:hypothetical protein